MKRYERNPRRPHFEMSVEEWLAQRKAIAHRQRFHAELEPVPPPPEPKPVPVLKFFPVPGAKA